MKISSTRKSKASRSWGPASPRKSAQTSFSSHFHEAEEQAFSLEFDQLMNSAQAAEKRVRNSLTLPDWNNYKKAIYELLEFLLKSGYVTDEKEGLTPSGRYYSHTLIRAIDKKMHDISMSFLGENEDKISILAQLDDLRGKLLDLYA